MSAWRQKVFLFWKSHRQVEQTASDCYWSKYIEWLQEGNRENAEDWDGLLHGPLVRQVHTATSSPQDPWLISTPKLSRSFFLVFDLSLRLIQEVKWPNVKYSWRFTVITLLLLTIYMHGKQNRPSFFFRNVNKLGDGCLSRKVCNFVLFVWIDIFRIQVAVGMCVCNTVVYLHL